MAAVDLVTYNNAVAEVRKLLGSWLTSGVDLFLRLRSVELDGVWKMGGHETFSDFLRQEFPNALGFERYRNVIQAIDLHGEDLVRTIGVHACHVMIAPPIAEDQKRRTQLQAEIKEHTRSEGVPPDPNKCADLRNRIFPECVKPSRESRAIQEREEMQAKIRELSNLVKEKDRAIAKLEKEIEKLKETARKAAAKSPKKKKS